MEIIKWQKLILSIVAYKKTNPSVSMYLFFDISPTQSCSFSLIVSFPLSFFWCLSHTLFSQTTTISLYVSLSLAQSPFYSPYRIYFVIVSPCLPLSLSLNLFGATSNYTSLYVCDIISLLPPFLLWYDYHYYFFVFVSIIIIFLLVLLLSYMKMNILEESLFLICHNFFFIFYFFIFYFFYFFISSLYTYFW